MNTLDLPRRRFLCLAMSGAALYSLDMPVAWASTDALLIENVTRLYPVRVARQLAPTSTAAVQQAVRDWPGLISVGGGRYSMGGQVALADSLHLDMRSLKQLVWFKPAEQRVRVQAGMRWRDLQEILDPHDLSVRTMQSFSNFTVGGSVSVNVHGRYVGHGPIAGSVLALQVVLADGQVVEASRAANAALFAAVIGGYGALGVITEVELALDRNVRMERSVESIALDDYPDFFARKVLADPSAIMHNADLLPPHFDKPVAVTWTRSDKALTETARLTPRDQAYSLERSVLWAMTELPAGGSLRKRVVQPRLMRPAVVWRNYEASLDVAMLEPNTRAITTYVLQEYFIPVRHFSAFVRGVSGILWLYEEQAQVINISIRHAPADADTLMTWAREEVFAFVLYYKQRVHKAARDEIGEWTRAMIDVALKYEGTYYLPYQLHATRAQFERAYPQAARLRELKRELDPAGRFSNELWRKYL